MINTVSFDKLGIHDIVLNRVAISNIFGTGLDVYWYAIIITAGLVLAMLFGMKHAKDVGLNADNILDVVIFGVPCALIGARLYYVIFEADQFHSFTDIINIRKGGLAIYGGLIAGLIVGLVYSKVKKINVLALFDIACMGFFIGQSIGRWGNFVNAEAFGGVTDLPWGMSINGGAPVHPTFLYESLWNLVGFILAYIYLKKLRKENGEIFFFYLAWYGAGRAWIEGLRTDSLWLGGIRVSQLVAGVSFIIGTTLIILVRTGVWGKIMNRFRKDTPAYAPVFSDRAAPDSEVTDIDPENKPDSEK